MPASSLTSPLGQQQKANEQLQRSISNLNLVARGIAAQQSAQAAARLATANGASVPDGMTEGGLKIDTNSLTAGWHNANAPEPSQVDGRTHIAIQQTGDKAILNWETFNVGRNTTVDFRQQKDWAVLNRVNDPSARPSQIQGQVKADGTVLIANRNGIVFSGSAQVDTRNLVAAAAKIGDDQFKARGIYSGQENGAYVPSFTDASGAVKVEAGARINTTAPTSVKQGGGYALLLGKEVNNAGTITTPRGQVQMAAGDFFIVRAGQGTASNQASTTRGNEVAPQFNTDSTAGQVINTGVLQAPEGDITLAGRKVVQDGVAIATTTVDARGTIHLLNSAGDTRGSVTTTARAVSAVLIDDQNGRTALNSQRDALIAESARQDLARRTAAADVFDNLARLDDRRDQSRIEIVSGGSVLFEGGSTTLATGGQIAVGAGGTSGTGTGRSTVANGARLDVSGAVGVQVAMASNNVQINIQGNEQRDAPLNRDTTTLNNGNVWIDRRKLLRVAAGVGGYEAERWYTAGGLLEVGGYLGLQGHTAGEWAAQGGSVVFSGAELITQTGSNINISGGTLDVQTGMIRQSWLKGADGRLYEVSNAPADIVYTGLYKGYEDAHKRWGDKTTGYFYNPLIGPQQRMDNGYTVGRDAGRLVVSTQAAVLEGDVTAVAYQGSGQATKRDEGLDGYAQSHNAAALAGQLVLGSYATAFNNDPKNGPTGLFYNLVPTLNRIVFGTDQPDMSAGLAPGGPLPQASRDALYIDSERLNGWGLGGLLAAGRDNLTVDGALSVAPGGSIALHAPQVDVNANLSARGGSIALGNVRTQVESATGRAIEGGMPAFGDTPVRVVIAKDAVLDARGLWTNLQRDWSDIRGLPFLDGGRVDIRTTGDLSLQAGTAIDVSSGAAVLVNGKTRGGRAGDVTLLADMQFAAPSTHGLLTIDGDIRGYGVNGGGTLRIASGTAIAIGGQASGIDGTLGTGVSATTDLILLQDYQVRAGEVLPTDYRYERLRANPGEAIGTMPQFGGGIYALTLAADWTPPLPTGSGNYRLSGTLNGAPMFFDVTSQGTRPTLPAGFIITSSFGAEAFPSSYVVPANVFPNGMMILPETVTVAAGNIAPADFTLTSGSRVATGAVFNQPVAVRAGLSVDPSLLQSGFARYDINGRLGVVVADNTHLDVRMPVYRVADSARTFATGSDPREVLERWTPPLWAEDPRSGVLTQRGGASLVLQSTAGSGTALVAGGPIDVRSGAAIEVDPGQSITLLGRDITVDGRLSAPSGTIAIDRPRSGTAGTPGLVWIGDGAVLDVAARAATARDNLGRLYGRVADGGTISIGGALDWEKTGEASVAEAFIVVRPGALLDASGTSAMLDGGAGAVSPIAVNSSGGSIILKSDHGLYLDGTLRAAAGGEGAAGGTLALALESASYPTATTSGNLLRHRELVLAQTQGESPIAAAQGQSDAKKQLLTGSARIGVDRIEAGGFDNLSMLVHGPLSFDGDVSLRMGESLRLYAGSYAHAENAAVGSAVSLAAPYVRLAGMTRIPSADGMTLPSAIWGKGPSQQPADGSFSVQADLIDVRDRVGFGVNADISLRSSSYAVDRRGFADVDIASSGDIRLLSGLPARGLSGSVTTELATPGNLTLTAAQIYPATGASAAITAGYRLPDSANGVSGYAPGSVLSIRRSGSGDVAMPDSVFGTLTLNAETVEQGGIVRAPLGRLTLGTEGNNSSLKTDRVVLLPGSITSVSAAGLQMPYGGTVDGLSYLYAGKQVTPESFDGNLHGIRLSARHVDAQSGAVLDLSGGGTLSGAGFTAGRGGSVDILSTPLANANPANGYSSAGNAVYAIVPGSAARYAPVAPDSGFGAPGIGQQVTIPSGVPGLPAGTYTLMPSNYALMPGAFRVEIGAAGRPGDAGLPATAVGNGTYMAAGYLGVANTSIREAMPNRIVVTPANKVRTYASYNETDYNSFVLADAARYGFMRGMLTSDAKSLDIFLDKPKSDDAVRTGLMFNGEARLAAEAGTQGFGGTVSVSNLSEVLAEGRSATADLPGASVHDVELNRLAAPRLMLNGRIVTTYGQRGRIADIQGEGALTVRSGARLSASDIVLVGNSLTIEEGASLSTIGRGRASFDSSDGYLFQGSGVLALSNGWFNLQLAVPGNGVAGNGSIDIGRCVSASCSGTTTLLSEGTIAVANDGTLTLADNVSYGTRNLVLALAAVNFGEDASIAAASAAGHLPRGLELNQARLDRLLAGNNATGAPALETLVLNARDAVNIFGAVDLDASRLDRLMLGTPAIYGYGAAGDVAAIRAGEFIWTGSEAVPGAPMGDLLGAGTLDISARSIVLGQGPNSKPENAIPDARLALGFSDVRLNASEKVTSNGKGTLAVFERQGAYTPGEGYARAGGNLHIGTPLLTGDAASTMRIEAGGAIDIAAASQGTAASADALGATLELKGRRIDVHGNVVLPSGRLVLSATEDIVLGAASRIDLSGRKVALFDVDKYSWGGDLVLSSAAGNIVQAKGGVIDVSAVNERAGTVEASALGASAGRVDLGGELRGSSSGRYDAGGTLVPYGAGELTVRAQTVADFAGLNQRLNAGSVFGARRFQIKQGDLTVGDGVKAREVAIVLDGGSLRVDGRIDASGEQVGTIRLAARGDLRVDGTLDAHATGLRVDSYGKIIDSPNRAIVDLTSRDGMLTLGSNARIDLRAGTDVPMGNGPGLNDGRARGTLDLNARRTGGDGAGGSGTGANDVALTVEGRPLIQGAKTIAVNAFRSYDDAPLAGLPDVSGYQPQLITQAYLDGIDVESGAFVDAALANTALISRLAGLDAWRLRPGVEIVSSASINPNGTLTVLGDIDLSGYRYGPDANRADLARRGFGEPGVLSIRAAGDLNIHGSINDGFAPPAATPDDKGWVLAETTDSFGRTGPTPFGADVIVPIDGVMLDTGTRFPAGAKLNYAIPIAGARLPAGTVLPVDAVLAGALNLPAGTVVGANVYNADGSIAYSAGSVLAAGVSLQAGMRLGAGTTLRAEAAVGALTWPKGVALPVAMSLANPLQLARGSLIPSMTLLELPGDQPINLRPETNGVQGRNWAVAPMLGEGATSWDVQLVAGADMGSADRRAVNPLSKAAIRLADSHQLSTFTTGIIGGGGKVWAKDNWFGYDEDTPVDPSELFWCDIEPSLCKDDGGQPGITGRRPAASAPSVVRTGTGDLELVAAGDVRTDSLFGIYTAGTSTAVDAAYNRPRARDADGSVLGAYSPLIDYGSSLATYRAWYPDQGGNVLIAAGGNLVGDIAGSQASSVLPGSWLWRQGSGTAVIDTPIPTSWWINFGTYTRAADGGSDSGPPLVGFTGIGALGGGDIRIRVGGDAGAIGLRGSQSSGTNTAQDRSEGLVIAVGSTGRVAADGTLALTGGGDIDMRVAGALNPQRGLSGGREKQVLTGAIANLRGQTQVGAASIGSLGLQSDTVMANDIVDPRGKDPFAATTADARGGINLVPGDTAMYLDARGDLVLGNAADPGRGAIANSSAYAVGGASYNGGGNGWFTLWTDRSAINLAAAGGNLTPTSLRSALDGRIQTSSEDGWIVYPSIFRAAALSGSLYYGYATLTSATRNPELLAASLTLAPSPTGDLQLLARDSIYAGLYGISRSGADAAALPTPFRPAFVGLPYDSSGIVVTNAAADGHALGFGTAFNRTILAFGPNTVSSSLANAAGAPPIRFYAAEGDIIGLKTGETVTLFNSSGTLYNAAAPVRIKAGRDIVNTGDAPGVSNIGAIEGSSVRSNLVVHGNPDDVSIVSAGRDILYANFDVGGPGTLEVTAGRNLLQEDRGGITSVGPVVPGDTRPGASIALMAGVGASAANAGLDMSAIRARYLDPSKLADAATPLAGQPGKAAKTYEAELAAWLKARYGFAGGSAAEALAYFDALAPEQQRIFLREVYYAELREGGREYNNPASSRSGSYLRGREMIATLFPDRDAAGKEIARNGDITMFGGSGVRTNFGGDIEMLAPGGRIIVGAQGAVPPATSGVMTQGQGNIRLFSEGSLLLGLSRIMTTFGGDIFAWSEKGDINAGRGSKTTVLFTPPKLVYDNLGNVEISPQAPSSGAGIATLAPIPEVLPGDVDLIAPLGTIDAGEAGIRVSGNVNVAALQVVNAANIQVKGDSTGLPLVASVNVGALTNASAAASQASMAAQDVMQRDRAAARQALPSVFTVRVLGFGGEPVEGREQTPSPKSGLQSRAARYDSTNFVQLIGHGLSFKSEMLSRLTDDERRQLQQDR
ncbi:filamentous haemagglutinin family protein [Variovorax boronicumulans]